MKLSRRSFLGVGAGLSVASLGGALAPLSEVQANDYKALVIVFLSGGYDGNNLLIPVDGAYGDYQKSRPVLALAKDSLLRLSGTHIDRQFAFTPSIRHLHEQFEKKRLAVVANAGALIQPTTLDQMRNNTAKLPPFLGSHAEQEQWIQGWMGDEDLSGWGGRALERLPASSRSKQALVALARDYTALVSNSLPISLADSGGNANWGLANLDDAKDTYTQRIEWASRLQSANAYEAEFARSLRAAYLDTMEFSKGRRLGPTPTGDFPNPRFSGIGRDLRFVAQHIPYSKATGAQRQVYLVQDGGYDRHAGQLDTSETDPGQDVRLAAVSQSLAALDKSIVDAGMDGQVLMLVMSEFSRTLDPASGVGSDHAWGNHWLALGGAVKGGKVYGDKFPTLLTGGVDDASLWNPKRGQWIPQYSSDQFVADAMRWMGLTDAQVLATMPNLNNFKTRTVGYI